LFCYRKVTAFRRPPRACCAHRIFADDRWTQDKPSCVWESDGGRRRGAVSRPLAPATVATCRHCLHTAQAQVADGGGAGRAPAAQAARAAAISRKHQCLAASNPRLDARLRRDLRTPRAYAAPRGLDAQSTMSSDGEDSSPRAAGMKVRLHAGGSPRRAASASPERAPAPRCAFGRAFR
jgi:hypothetical protein